MGIFDIFRKRRRHEEIHIGPGTRFVIGQPASYPTELAASLTDLFSTRPEVRSAYLALLQYPDRAEPPHTVIGINIDGGPEELLDQAGPRVRHVTKPNEFVDFVVISSGNQLSEYFSTIEPFYRAPGSP